MLSELVATVTPVDAAVAEAAARRHARLAKPPGSLGELERLGGQLAAIAGRCPPPIPQRPAVIVAAADHGVHAQGVSDWPQSITGAMVRTIETRRGAVNAIARTVGANVIVVDVGTITDNRPISAPRGDLVAGDPVDDPHRGSAVTHIEARVRAGTRDITREAAMTREECATAISLGARVARRAIAACTDLIALGDLGIANTTASACLIAAYTGAAPHTVTGPGANRDHRRVAHKIDVVTAALQRHGADRDPLGVLASLGGFEHATLVGAALACAGARVPVVLDGVTAGATALATAALAPHALGYLIAGHVSTEPGATTALAQLGLTPLLALQLRLGEGTGALLAIPLLQAAARTLTDIALIDDIT